MKKVLLATAAVLAAVTARADVYTFVVDGCDPHRASQASQSHVTTIPLGYYGIKSSDAYDSGAYTTAMQTPKAMVSDALMLEDVVEGNFVAYGSWRLLKYAPLKVTPAQGLTITGIKVQGSNPNFNQTMSIVTPAEGEGTPAVVQDFTVNESDTTNTWKGSYNQPFYISCTSSGAEGKTYYMRAIYLEFTVEGTSTQVAVPVCDKTVPVVAKNEPITLTCPTDGAKIYYTVSYDGSTVMPTEASTLYTGPFTLERDGVVRAIAVKEGMATSFPTYNEFYVMDENDGIAAKFDFTDFTSLTLATADGNVPVTGDNFNNGGYPAAKGGTSTLTFTSKTFIDNGYTLKGNGKTNSNAVISDAYGQACEYRATKTGAGFVIDAPEGKALKAVLIQGSWLEFGAASGYPGTLEANPINASNKMWKAPAGETVTSMSFTNNSTASASRYISRVYAIAADNLGGIDAIGCDDTNAPVEYYNLQGIKVANPQGGVYIKRQGTKVTKVVIR